MKCILVFDTLNDLIFIKFNSLFCNHVKKMAKQQGLTSKENFNDDEGWLNPDLIIQLFSPLITSQRIMTSHFSNGYCNIQCGDETNIVFDNYMGHLFICISNGETRWLKRVLAVCISLTKHICGPDVSLLKTCTKRSNALKKMLDVWYKQVKDNVEQSIIVEAVEQLRMNSQVAMVTIKALQEATEKMKSLTEFTQVHALILVNHKFLSLYSSRNASELTASDILLLSLLGAVAHEISDHFTLNAFADSSNESLNDSLANISPIGYDHSSNTSIDESERRSDFSDSPESSSFTLLLSKWKPHAVHVSYIASDIPLFLIHEIGNENLNVALFEALESSINLQELHMRGTNTKDVLIKSIDVMDSSMRKLIDVFKKKILSAAPDKSHLGVVKGITKKWEACKKKYQECIKSQDMDCIRKLESSIDSITNALRNTYSNAMLNNSITSVDQIIPIADNVRKTLREFTDFIRVKATRNFTIGSRSTLSINKYLEEFPGLVHFMFIDRNTHRIVAPGLDFSCPETTSLTRKKLFKMIDLSRSYVEEGRTAVMWKDTVFSYSYFLWFEDISGTPIKSRISPASVVKSLSPPGILCGNFYQQLIDKCFPKKSPDKIRCFELYTIHLGLATSSCVLEHCRRLTATIWEVTGVPTNPLDLL